MNVKILKMLEEDARISVADIATALDMTREEVEEEISDMEQKGIIRGYKCVVDEDALDSDTVSAIIELKVTPKAGRGFEEVAEKITLYPSVESVYLMSGACDLTVIVRGKSFREVSSFVSRELATIDGVTATATQFIMKRYKDFGVELVGSHLDERRRVIL